MLTLLALLTRRDGWLFSRRGPELYITGPLRLAFFGVLLWLSIGALEYVLASDVFVERDAILERYDERTVGVVLVAMIVACDCAAASAILVVCEVVALVISFARLRMLRFDHVITRWSPPARPLPSEAIAPARRATYLPVDDGAVARDQERAPHPTAGAGVREADATAVST